ncbi:MAG: AMP-binding protein [Bacilli bacterium]|jgi:long-subunit acyl-CoA synthetase (AMP-forming)/acyl carrier protein|nr:AMP-binding protein [Bacilli bacterium]
MSYTLAQAQTFVDPAADLLKGSQTLKDIYEQSTSRHLNERACSFFDEDGKMDGYTYEKYKSITFNFATHMSTALSAMGAGSIVGLKLKNSQNWAHVFWSILMTGHVPLLIDAKLPHDNTENLLQQSKATAIIANEEAPYSVPLFRINEIRNAEADYQFAASWANQVIFCSSGTTGAVKMMVTDGKALCHQICGSLDMPKESPTILHPGKTNILAMIPFHHIFGFTAVFLWYTYYGKNIVYPSSMASTDLLNAIRKGRVTHIYSVPLFWDSIAQTVLRSAAQGGQKSEAILQNMIAYNCHQITKKEAGFASWGIVGDKIRKKVFGSQVEYCISGGGYLSSRTLTVINGLGYPLYDGFGMTEVGVTSVELSPRVEDRLKGSIGHPFHGMEYKIEPIKGGNPGQGELLIKSPTVHVEEIIGGVRGKTKLDNGYFHSGDIVEKDSSGEYYVKGRVKDVIISSNGENVYPDEIEFYFRNVRHVVNDVVVGVKTGESQEKIVLVLELDNLIKDEELEKLMKDIEAINATLPNEKRVGETLIYKGTLPLANNMKVKRFTIKEALKNDRSQFVSFSGETAEESDSLAAFDPKDVAPTREKVKAIFSKTLLLPSFKIDDKATWTELGGDSMSYVAMVSDLNDGFGLEIPTEKYGHLYSVNDFVAEVLTLQGKGKDGK